MTKYIQHKFRPGDPIWSYAAEILTSANRPDTMLNQSA